MLLHCCSTGRPENCSAGGRGGHGRPQKVGGWWGGLAKWTSVPGPFVMLFWQLWLWLCLKFHVLKGKSQFRTYSPKPKLPQKGHCLTISAYLLTGLGGALHGSRNGPGVIVPFCTPNNSTGPVGTAQKNMIPSTTIRMCFHALRCPFEKIVVNDFF